MRVRKKANPLVLLFMGVTFTVIGASVILFLATKTEFICQREPGDQGVCTLKHDKILSDDERKINTIDLLGAYVDESYSSDSRTYCVILETSTGEINFSGSYSSGSTAKNEIASQINNFVKNKNQKELYVEQDDRWIIYITGGMFLVVGIGMTLGSLAMLTAFL